MRRMVFLSDIPFFLFMTRLACEPQLRRVRFCVCWTQLGFAANSY
jgi:hypothetical protein